MLQTHSYRILPRRKGLRVGEERVKPDSGVVDSRGIAKKGSVTNGCIGRVFAVIKKSEAPSARFPVPTVLLKRAPAPVAVFSFAVLRRSVRAPMAVLKLPSVRLRSEYTPTPVL